jgi:Phosphatidylinositol-specific phospholipase C, Y domain
MLSLLMRSPRRHPRKHPQMGKCSLVRSPKSLGECSGLMLSLELKHDLSRVRRGFSEAKQEIARSRNVLRLRSPSNAVPTAEKVKVRMSMSLVALLVYTVGVKCRGINKKEHYAPEHMFSLSESTANKMFKRDGMHDLIKHNRTHLVRLYPKGTRVSSTNYEPHRYWGAGMQLVALNWQTCGAFDRKVRNSALLTIQQIWAT